MCKIKLLTYVTCIAILNFLLHFFFSLFCLSSILLRRKKHVIPFSKIEVFNSLATTNNQVFLIFKSKAQFSCFRTKKSTATSTSQFSKPKYINSDTQLIVRIVKKNNHTTLAIATTNCYIK